MFNLSIAQTSAHQLFNKYFEPLHSLLANSSVWTVTPSWSEQQCSFEYYKYIFLFCCIKWHGKMEVVKVLVLTIKSKGSQMENKLI